MVLLEIEHILKAEDKNNQPYGQRKRISDSPTKRKCLTFLHNHRVQAKFKITFFAFIYILTNQQYLSKLTWDNHARHLEAFF